MSGDQLDLDAIEAQHQVATQSHARLTLPVVDDFNIGATLADVPALVAEVRRLRALVVVDDDSHPAFQPPSDHAGYFVESP